MKVLKITLEGSDICCIKADDLDVLVDNPLDIVSGIVRTLVEEGSVGDKVTLELVEMNEAEYDALPEFQGF